MQNQIDPEQYEFIGMGEANANPILLPQQQPMTPPQQQPGDLSHLVFPQDPAGYYRSPFLPLGGPIDSSSGKIAGAGMMWTHPGQREWAIPGVVRDTINDLALTAMAPGYAAQGRLATSDLPAVANRMAMTLAAGGVGASTLAEPELDANVLGSFRGFHGTSHTFEPVDHNPFGEFSDEKIGSGEGAQAFGYGHYVAGNPETAEMYRTAGAPKALMYQGKPIYSQDALQILNGELRKRGIPINNPSGALNSIYDPNYRAMMQRSGVTVPNDVLNVAQELFSLPKGNLYHVEIRPDEHELLDWNKPLSQQSSHVLDKLKEIIPNIQAVSSAPDKDLMGRSVYHNLSNMMGGPENASWYLNDKGVPGIKYLDQFSRSRPPEQQTRNYTIFHPSNLKIIGRNGEELATQPVEHNPFTHTATPVEHDPFANLGINAHKIQQEHEDEVTRLHTEGLVKALNQKGTGT